MRCRRTIAAGIAALLAAALLAACGDDDDDSSSGDDAVVVTFEVAGGEQFKVELASPELAEHARALLEGENLSAIPLGTVVRDDPGVNAPWTWHLDPATFQFAFATIEVCDGIPSDVESGAITSDSYCPWSAKVVAVAP